MPAPRPRDAATLILVRHDGPAPRILMGRRAPGHSFMPDLWVFPGGAVDRLDYRLQPLADLPDDTAEKLARSRRLARQRPDALARALACAAVRETAEETGLILGAIEGGRLRPRLDTLTYVARAITPPARHRRFDARFLMTDAAALSSLEPQDSRELPALGWFTLDEARGLALPAITRAILDHVDALLAGRAGEAPFWRWTRGPVPDAP